MINPDQWSAICAYARDALSNKDSFKIFHAQFEEMFLLKQPYYQEMLGLAARDHVEFDFHSPWKTTEGDPGDQILFSRRR